MPFYVYAWLALFGYASTIIITKLTSKHSIKNAWLLNYIWTISTLLFTIPPAIYYHATLPANWWPVLLTGIFAALWNVLYIQAMYKLDVSTLSPLFNFRLVFALILGSIFFREHLTSFQFLMSLIIFVGGIFATVDERFNIKSFLNPSIGIGLLAMLSLALNNASVKSALFQNSLWTTNLWMNIIALLVLTPTIYLFKKDIKKMRVIQVTPVLGMGLFQAFGDFTANVAYHINLSLTSLILAVPMSMVFAFLFSIFSPKLLEKHTLKVYAIRFSAAFCMILAALQLSR